MTAIVNKIDTKVYGKLLQKMLPRVIKNDEELKNMLEMVNHLIIKKRTPEEDELLLLVSSLVEAYEDKHHAIEPLPPYQFLKELMSDRRVKQKDLLPVFGSSGIASEVVNGKRKISKAQAKKLAEFFKLSVEYFI